MANITTPDFLKEPLQIEVLMEADIVVVGSIPAGRSTAIASIMSGAKTVLTERYSHMCRQAAGAAAAMTLTRNITSRKIALPVLQLISIAFPMFIIGGNLTSEVLSRHASGVF
jgi:hypothetical protein